MKHLVLAIFCLLTVKNCLAQSDRSHTQAAAYDPKVYDKVVAKFQQYYNQRAADSIPRLFSDQYGDTRDKLWDETKLKKLHKKYGNILSYSYLGEKSDRSASIYKLVCSKSTHAMGILLDVEGKLIDFRFNTNSEQIDKLLKASK